MTHNNAMHGAPHMCSVEILWTISWMIFSESLNNSPSTERRTLKNWVHNSGGNSKH